MHDTHEVGSSNLPSPTTLPIIISFYGTTKSKIEWIVILTLTLLFAVIWLFAHWNLSRKPPYHKGPGSPGYVELEPPSESNKTNE